MGQWAGIEVAHHVHVQAQLGRVKIGEPVGVGDAAAVRRNALAGALHALVGGCVGFIHAYGCGLEGPVIVEAVFKVQVVRGYVGFCAAPAGAGVSRTRQVDRFATGVAWEAAQHRPGLLTVVAYAAAHCRRIGQVDVQRTVQRMVFAPDIVDEAVALVLVSDKPPAHTAVGRQRAAGIQLQAIVVPGASFACQRNGRRRLATLAHQVDCATWAAGALQQARSTAQHFHPVEEHQVLGCPVAQRIVVSRNRHTVVLPVINLKATRGHDHARANALRADNARGVVKRVLQVGDALVIQLLARDDGDRLGNLLEGVRAFAQGHRAGGIRPGAFAGCVHIVVGDAGAAQLHDVAAQVAGRHTEMALGGNPQLQAATGQRSLHGLLGTHLADHGRCLLAAHQCWLQRDDVAALAGDAVERVRQAGGWQVEHLGLRLGKHVEAGQGSDQGQGAGQGVVHGLLPNEVAVRRYVG
ncbi:hypothetical protein D3C76_710710 [compost metagenome]